MRKMTIFLGNKWGNKECIIIKDSAMKRVGLKMQASIKNQWRYFWNGNKPDK
jgi:hypothetical protein